MPKLSDAGKPGERAPEGSWRAMIVGFIDLGTQDPSPETLKKFKDAEPQRKCNVEFALEPTGKVKRTDGKPFIIAKRDTYSPSAKSNLMKYLRKAFAIKSANIDMSEIIGRVCTVTTEHNGDKYTNIIDVSALPAGTKLKGLEKIATRTLFLTPDEFDEEVFDKLNDKTKETIMGSPEYDECTTTPKKKKPAKKK